MNCGLEGKYRLYDAATESFLSDASTATHDKTALLDYLEARPNRENDIPFYINDVEWRIKNLTEYWNNKDKDKITYSICCPEIF